TSGGLAGHADRIGGWLGLRRRRRWRRRRGQRRTRRPGRPLARDWLRRHAADDRRCGRHPTERSPGHHDRSCRRRRRRRVAGCFGDEQHGTRRRARCLGTARRRGSRGGSPVRRRILMVAMILASWPTLALAADDTTASALILQGADLFKRENYEGARAAFARAYELDPKAATPFTLP